jgi:sugar (pentulose or hexulose) kinase
MWNDQRTAVEAAETERRSASEQLVQITGSRSFTGFTAPKLLWLRQNATIAYKRLHYLLLPKDYLRLMLTGELATDVGDASGTGVFDVGARAWSDEIIDALDLDRDILPPAYEGPEITGRVLSAVGRRRPGRQYSVVAGAGDNGQEPSARGSRARHRNDVDRRRRRLRAVGSVRPTLGRLHAMRHGARYPARDGVMLRRHFAGVVRARAVADRRCVASD